MHYHWLIQQPDLPPTPPSPAHLHPHGIHDLNASSCLSLDLSISHWDLGLNHRAPLTTQDVKGHVQKSATLRCKLATHHQDWFVINWHRVSPMDEPVLLVGLPVRNKIPEWGPDISADFQARLRPIITVEKSHVEFNIKLSNLTCEDDGEYSCSAVTLHGEITATSKLTIKELEEVREEPKLGAVCTGSECEDLNSPPSDSLGGPTDDSTRLSSLIGSATLASLACLFHLLWLRL
ncbi:hypothetical protein ElyMa_001681200 [Elysia marginata]|uniref:Ig-like domain-containing protein n=1 Tax=Elysia marginata TaxID=1093978 RepID=A0AAV4JQX8_9GAST|nr:hypothetical protein ElyMa_001681200 [Elysia marginata]